MTKFKEFQLLFNQNIGNIIDEYIEDRDIKEKIKYAIHGGKRLRPIIVLSICNQKNDDIYRCLKYALAMELIHTASLLLDDLPSMDNDNERRNQPSFHIKYSVVSAQLISNILLGLSFKLIYDNFKETNNLSKIDIIINNVTKNLGLLGAAGGQFLDLTPFSEFDRTKLKSKKNIENLFQMKTTSFFEMAFLGSYLLNYDNSEKEYNESLLLEASTHFGLCFQIYDDFDDIEQDKQRSKLDLFDPNYVNNFGLHDANKEFHKNINLFITKMKTLNLFTLQMQEICFMLIEKIKKINDESNIS